MTPHVLAIEPDLRQAAIVKRIVREKVLADITVVDSRDAALEAMRTTVPDVLLLSALLSPRDEDELVAHLRTLRDAAHLQTHTIPQLASAIASGDGKPARGLLKTLWRRKGAGAAPEGCDPDLFADEVRAYLERASEKKREVREHGTSEPVATPVRRAASAVAEQEPAPAAAPAPTASASWESPFEWRPSRASSSPAGEADAMGPEFPAVSLEATPAGAEVDAVDLAPHPRWPLVVRRAREWWYEEGERRRAESEPDSELDEVLSGLAAHAAIACVTSVGGCRIRRVRLGV
jgi:hypothetical protein